MSVNSNGIDLAPYLESLEAMIDPVFEDGLHQEWKSYADGRNKDAPFQPISRKPCIQGIKWPRILINDAYEDETLMILSQFGLIAEELRRGTGHMLTVRSNYGCGIIPSMFGAEIFLMEREMNFPSNSRTISPDGIKRLIDSDFPKMSDGLGAKIFSVAEKYQEIMRKYPKIGKYIRIDHPDFQGPFDLAELMYGSEIFADMYDNRELIHALLRKLTDFFIHIMDRWLSLFPNNDEYHIYFGSLHKGALCIRCDSSMNISPDFYGEFVFPYDQEILSRFNGGAFHFCGKGDHYISKLSEMKHLYAVDLCQPQFNDMDLIFKKTIDKGINLITYNWDYDGRSPDIKHDYSRLLIKKN